MFKDVFVLDNVYLGMLNKLNLTLSKAERLIEDISFEYVMEPDDKDIYLGGMADHLEIHIPDKKLEVIKNKLSDSIDEDLKNLIFPVRLNSMLLSVADDTLLTIDADIRMLAVLSHKFQELHHDLLTECNNDSNNRTLLFIATVRYYQQIYRVIDRLVRCALKLDDYKSIKRSYKELTEYHKQGTAEEKQIQFLLGFYISSYTEYNTLLCMPEMVTTNVSTYLISDYLTEAGKLINKLADPDWRITDKDITDEIMEYLKKAMRVIESILFYKDDETK